MNKVAAKRNKQLKPNTAPRHFYVVAAVIVLVYTVLAARSAYIRVIHPDLLKKPRDRRSKQITGITVQRGAIVE